MTSVQFIQAQTNNGKADSAQTQFWKGWSYTFHYPKKANDSHVQGKVVIAFDIDSTCSVVNVRLVKGIGYGYDEEAVKAVKNVKPIYPKDHKCIPHQNILQTFNFTDSDD